MNNNQQLKKWFKIAGFIIVFLYIGFDILANVSRYDAINAVLHDFSILIFPIILISVIVIIYFLFKTKKIKIAEKRINILKMLSWGFVLILDIGGILFLIYILIFAQKISQELGIEIILMENLNSPTRIILLIVEALINIGIFVYFLKNFLKYYRLVKSSENNSK